MANFYANNTLSKKDLRDYFLKANMVFETADNFERWLKLDMLEKTAELYNWFQAETKRIMKEEGKEEYLAHNRARTYAIRVCGFCSLALTPEKRVNTGVFPQNMDAPVEKLEFGFEELEKLYSHIQKPKDQLIFQLICLYGTLPSDLVELEYRDIKPWNDDHQVIQKARQKTRNKGGYWITLVPNELYDAITKHKEDLGLSDSEKLFQETTNAMTQMVKRACKRAGLPKITIQQIRRWCGTQINKALKRAEKDFEGFGDTDSMIDAETLYAFWTAHKHATIEKQVKNNHYITDSIDDMCLAFPYIAEKVYIGSGTFFKKMAIETKKEAKEILDENKAEMEKMRSESFRNANEMGEMFMEFMKVVGEKQGIKIKPKRSYTNDLEPKEKHAVLMEDMKDLMRRFTES